MLANSFPAIDFLKWGGVVRAIKQIEQMLTNGECR